MSLDFPNNPIVGTTFPYPPVPGEPVWVWDGDKWVGYMAPQTVGGDFLPLVGGIMTGPITLPGNPTAPLQAVPMQYAVAKAGDTMTGPLVLSGNPVNNLDAVPKQFLDQAIDNFDYRLASAAQLRAMINGRVIDTTGLRTGLSFVPYGPVSGTWTPDFTAFINAIIELDGNTTLEFPTQSITPLIGRSGLLLLTNSAVSTLSYATGYVFDLNAVPNIPTTINANNLLTYSVLDAAQIQIAVMARGMTP